MKNIFYVILALFLLFTTYLSSQDNAKQENYEKNLETTDVSKPNPAGVVNVYDVLPLAISEKCNNFFKTLMTDAASKAYNDILDGSPIKINDDKVKNQIIKTVEAIELYGKVEGFELIGNDEISSSYMKVKYLSLHAYNPLLWTFAFYNSPKNGWIVLNMKLTDEL